jgi:pimeloyl-ACP methyl ester carboxylesterase
MMGRLVAAFALAALLAAPASAMPPQVFEREVHVGGRIVRALCTPGPGQALLLQDAGAGADEWRAVLERLDGVVGACAYDRSAAGEEPSTPRGWFELMDDMRRVHDALGFARGYTLVGHSTGGLYARLYAADRPTDVGGLVLVEPSHEDMPEEAKLAMPPVAWEEWMRRRRLPNADGVRETEVAKRMRESRLRDVPVTVITATRRPDGAGWNARLLNEAARRVHATVLEGVTHGRHVPAGRSGGDVHLEQPELVAREIVRLTRPAGGSDE